VKLETIQPGVDAVTPVFDLEPDLMALHRLSTDRARRTGPCATERAIGRSCGH
jgi:hypothetical protein